jgi:prepilin-type N-terminal cleavage/methylation domain-containing protein
MTASAQAGPQIRSASTVGSTLLELIVALAVLGILLAVTTIVLRPEASAGPGGGLQRAARARERALESGHPVGDTFTIAGRAGFLVALPDGRVVADTMLHLDPATGRPSAPEE